MNTQSNNISKSKVMKKAWADFRAYNGITMTFFAQCMKDAWAYFKKNANRNVNDMIQAVKEEILNINSRRVMGSSIAADGMATVRAVAKAALGFASDVATTVAKYGKASEKQAYVIARAAVENGI
jgi:hypothetical protein